MSRSPPPARRRRSTGDGAACQGGAVGTPFFLFTNGTNPRGLFANAYQPDTPVTGAAERSQRVGGDAERHGEPARRLGERLVPVRHDHRLRTDDRAAVDRREQRGERFTAQLNGLPAATTIHYRAVAVSDFGTFVGADQTLKTASSEPTPRTEDR